MSSPRSSSSTILLILVLVLTAPIWLTIGGVLLGVFGGIVGGLFGAFFGLFGALIGGFFALLALPFKILFGDWSCFDGGWSHGTERGLFFLCLLILVVGAMRNRKQVSK